MRGTQQLLLEYDLKHWTSMVKGLYISFVVICREIECARHVGIGLAILFHVEWSWERVSNTCFVPQNHGVFNVHSTRIKLPYDRN